MYAHAQLEVESRLIERRKTSPQAVDELPDLGDRLRSSGIQQVQDGTVPVVDKEAGTREVGPQDNPYTYQFGANGYWRQLSQLFSEPRCTRALLSAAVAMITQQMTGVNTRFLARPSTKTLLAPTSVLKLLQVLVWHSGLRTTSLACQRTGSRKNTDARSRYCLASPIWPG